MALGRKSPWNPGQFLAETLIITAVGGMALGLLITMGICALWPARNGEFIGIPRSARRSRSMTHRLAPGTHRTRGWLLPSSQPLRISTRSWP